MSCGRISKIVRLNRSTADHRQTPAAFLFYNDGMSFWLNRAPFQNFRSTPELPSNTQAVVIGGGITGVSAAYWLRRFGVEVTLIERRGLSGGATGRNGGHIVSGPTLDFGEAVKRYGPHTARAIFQYTLDNLAALQTFVIENQIDCEMALGGTATLALDPTELSQLAETAGQLSAHNIPFDWWDAATASARTGSPDFLGGPFNPNAGRLWPAKLVFGLAGQASRFGANIQTGTEVLNVEPASTHFTVHTTRGAVHAEVIVYATNAWARTLIPALEQIIVPVRGQVLVTEPAPPMWGFGFVTNHGYEYCTQRADGRIVLGGMRWKSATLEMNIADDSTLHPEVSAGLRGFLPAHFPALRGIKIQQEWSGIMAFTPDFNPLIGPLPNRPGEYIAAGYSGHGMPMAFGAGKTAAEMIADRTLENFVKAFLPDRFF